MFPPDSSQPSPLITNFLRYPGSKRRMLAFLAPYLPQRDSIRRYVEPFVGGGAVFLFLQPRRAVLSDINPDLIDLYRGIRSDPSAVWRFYCAFGSTKAAYRRVRDSQKSPFMAQAAARTLFLNRTCFKGMWRTNRDGGFNVGYGGQSRRWVITEPTLSGIARALQTAQLRCSDFEPVVDQCGPGDFIFVDPPYRPGQRQLTNDHYIGRQFTLADHHRLAGSLHRAQRRGVRWLLTTSAHPDVLNLFNRNYMLDLPKGTGPQPGALIDNPGEALVSSHSLEKRT